MVKKDKVGIKELKHTFECGILTILFSLTFGIFFGLDILCLDGYKEYIKFIFVVLGAGLLYFTFMLYLNIKFKWYLK